MTMTFPAYCQKSPIGKYYHNFGHRLLLKSDSTYEFNTGFDLSFYWSNGTWTFSNDTIFLINKPIFDTLKVSQDKDTLILSTDPISERVDGKSYIASLLSGGRQNRIFHPQKLLLRKNTLLIIDENGPVVTKDLYDPMRQKHFSTKFYKSKEWQDAPNIRFSNLAGQRIYSQLFVRYSASVPADGWSRAVE